MPKQFLITLLLPVRVRSVAFIRYNLLKAMQRAGRVKWKIMSFVFPGCCELASLVSTQVWL
jgi:hypothetical protein